MSADRDVRTGPGGGGGMVAGAGLASEPARADKLELDPARHGQRGAGPMTAIIKVNLPGYVPDQVAVRARIGPEMFTAEFDSSILDRLQDDPLVVSIGRARRLEAYERSALQE